MLRQCGFLTNRDRGDDAPQELYGEHCLRVSGAQFLAGKGVETTTIALYGRWGSTAIARYVQNAPLRTASRSNTEAVLARTAQRLEERLQALEREMRELGARVEEQQKTAKETLRKEATAQGTQQPPEPKAVKRRRTGAIRMGRLRISTGIIIAVFWRAMWQTWRWVRTSSRVLIQGIMTVCEIA